MSDEHRPQRSRRSRRQWPQPNHDARPTEVPSPPQVARRRCPPSASAWRAAARETDYIFSYWSALGWTILTLGIYGFYVFYQLVRRMRDHNARQSNPRRGDRRGVGAGQTAGPSARTGPPPVQAAGHLAVLRQMTQDFVNPSSGYCCHHCPGHHRNVAFVLLDQDLIKNSQAEDGAGGELSVIYTRLGQPYPSRSGRAKGPDNYVGRILAAIFTLGIYMFWWFYNQMDEPNKHFAATGPKRTNW
jgi:hypothetical protein